MLLVDLGNSFIKWGIKSNTGLTLGKAFPHKAGRPDPSIERLWGELDKPDRVIVANVAGAEMASKLRDWLAKKWQIHAEFVQPQREAFGVLNGYGDPHALGVDRWVGLVGLKHYYHLPACIVDCGTAITLDFLDRNGIHRGGLIMPGLSLMERSLQAGTHGIATIESETEHSLGENTGAAIASGILCAASGFVEQGFSDLNSKCKSQPILVITGGDGQSVAKRISIPCVYDAGLIVKGLSIVAD